MINKPIILLAPAPLRSSPPPIAVRPPPMPVNDAEPESTADTTIVLPVSSPLAMTPAPQLPPGERPSDSQDTFSDSATSDTSSPTTNLPSHPSRSRQRPKTYEQETGNWI